MLTATTCVQRPLYFLLCLGVSVSPTLSQPIAPMSLLPPPPPGSTANYDVITISTNGGFREDPQGRCTVPLTVKILPEIGELTTDGVMRIYVLSLPPHDTSTPVYASARAFPSTHPVNFNDTFYSPPEFGIPFVFKHIGLDKVVEAESAIVFSLKCPDGDVGVPIYFACNHRLDRLRHFQWSCPNLMIDKIETGGVRVFRSGSYIPTRSLDAEAASTSPPGITPSSPVK